MYDPLPEYYTNRIVLSREEERELLIAAKAGDREARDSLIMANLTLIIYLARPKKQHQDLDIINEGVEGLLIAIDKFDMSMKNRFATFARHWVSQKIINGIYYKANLNKISYKARQKFIKNNIVRQVDVSDDKLDTLLSIKPSIESDLIRNQQIETIREALSTLKDRELDIIVSHVMEESCTLEVLGDKYGITRERIRQIEKETLDKLRKKLKKLKEKHGE